MENDGLTVSIEAQIVRDDPVVTLFDYPFGPSLRWRLAAQAADRLGMPRPVLIEEPRQSHVSVRCPCGAEHLFPNTRRWRAAAWILRNRVPLIAASLALLSVLLVVGKGLVIYAAR